MEIKQINCGHCGSQEQLKIGPEEHEKTFDDAKPQFKGKTKLHIKSLKEKHKINHVEYGYAIYACPKCNTLHNPYAVEVEYDDILVFKPYYKCQVCLSTLVKATNELENYSCSSCGKNFKS